MMVTTRLLMLLPCLVFSFASLRGCFEQQICLDHSHLGKELSHGALHLLEGPADHLVVVVRQRLVMRLVPLTVAKGIR